MPRQAQKEKLKQHQSTHALAQSPSHAPSCCCHHRHRSSLVPPASVARPPHGSNTSHISHGSQNGSRKNKTTTSSSSWPTLAAQPRRRILDAVDRLDIYLSKIFRLRFRQDCCRLLSARIHHISRQWIPPMIASLFAFSGPGWFAANAFNEESGIKDVFRNCLLMDFREMDDRVWTSSAEWTYTCIRHMVSQEGFEIPESGTPASDLINFLPHLRKIVLELESDPTPICQPLPHFPSLRLADTNLIAQMERAKNEATQKLSPNESPDPCWNDGVAKLEYSIQRAVDALWDVVAEFDVAAFGQGVELAFNIKGSGLKGWETVLRYEPIVREEEEERMQSSPSASSSSSDLTKYNTNTKSSSNSNNKNSLPSSSHQRSSSTKGKTPAKYWDGRGGGISDWGTANEEDVWVRDIDSYAPDDDDIFPGSSPSHPASYWFREAEKHREKGNNAFNSADYVTAVDEYTHAHHAETRLPVYLLNRAMANLRLKRYDEAERDCTLALSKHLASSKGLWRRARVRRIIGTREQNLEKLLHAEQDLLTLLDFQPANAEARAELMSLREQIGKPGMPAETSDAPRRSRIRHYQEHYRQCKVNGIIDDNDNNNSSSTGGHSCSHCDTPNPSSSVLRSTPCICSSPSPSPSTTSSTKSSSHHPSCSSKFNTSKSKSSSPKHHSHRHHNHHNHHHNHHSLKYHHYQDNHSSNNISSSNNNSNQHNNPFELPYIPPTYPPLPHRTNTSSPPPFEFSGLDKRRLHFSCDIRQKDGVTFQIRKLEKP